MRAQKKVVVLGGGGFIGGHLGRALKNAGYHVRIADLKRHEYFSEEDISHEFIVADLRNPESVALVIDDEVEWVFQLAADMGGAGYIFTGLNDANVMHNSALINLNVAKECVVKGVKRVFYSSSACMYPEHNQLDPQNPNCDESSAYPANPDSEYGWKSFLVSDFTSRSIETICLMFASHVFITYLDRKELGWEVKKKLQRQCYVKLQKLEWVMLLRSGVMVCRLAAFYLLMNV